VQAADNPGGSRLALGRKAPPKKAAAGRIARHTTPEHPA